jgi:hypothetical protein
MSDVKLLSADDVLSADDRRYEIVDVPEWGGSLRLRSMSAKEALDWAEKNDGPAKSTAGIRIAVISACDADGALIFADKDIEALKGRSNKALKRVVTKALALNGFSDDEQVAAAAKNDSGETLAGASPTASRRT